MIVMREKEREMETRRGLNLRFVPPALGVEIRAPPQKKSFRGPFISLTNDSATERRGYSYSITICGITRANERGGHPPLPLPIPPSLRPFLSAVRTHGPCAYNSERARAFYSRGCLINFARDLRSHPLR